MPSKLCSECGEIVKSQEWQSHRQTHVRSRRQRPGTTGAWRRLRAVQLKRQPYCAICGSTERLEVHHVNNDWENEVDPELETRCFDHNPRGREPGTVHSGESATDT